jgi:phosphoenolpyruvate carboxylase
MQEPTWHFYPKLATDTIRNPTAGEFFSTEAVGDVAETLVREGIQNSLDSRKEREDGFKELAHVRIFLSESDDALLAPSVPA